mgnify:CR=1 FL=1
MRGRRAHTLPEVVVAGMQEKDREGRAVSGVLEQGKAAARVAKVVERLQACPLPGAGQDLEDMGRASPFSLEAAWHGWHRARALETLEAVFEVERGLVQHVLERPDIAEGIRARLVDRDNAPLWQPAPLEDLPAPAPHDLPAL